MVYGNGNKTNRINEPFTIERIERETPITHTIEDEDGEIIQGKYFGQELHGKTFDFNSNEDPLRVCASSID